jgi:hypothetical protein
MTWTLGPNVAQPELSGFGRRLPAGDGRLLMVWPDEVVRMAD